MNRVDRQNLASGATHREAVAGIRGNRRCSSNRPMLHVMIAASREVQFTSGVAVNGATLTISAWF